jgi:hypothetical protein
MAPGKKTLRLGCLLTTALILLAIVVRVVWVRYEARIDAERGWTVERIETSINAELPPHADRMAVAAWFDSHRISHRYYSRSEGKWEYDSERVTKAGLRESELIGMDYCCMDGEQANVGYMESGRILIYFFIDKQGQVAGHLVESDIYYL